VSIKIHSRGKIMNNFHQKILEVQQYYVQKIQLAQANQEYDKISVLAEEMKVAMEKIMAQFSTPESDNSLNFVQKKSEYYRHAECEVDLDQFVYDGDKSYFEKLMNHPLISSINKNLNSHQLSNSKKRIT
jgi:hypothetical protein